MNNKKLAIFSLLLLLLIPAMFQGPHDNLSLGSYFVRCVMPLMMIIVFWLNYLWLVPKAIGENSIKKLVLMNIGLVFVMCIIMSGWHWIEMNFFREFQNVRPPRFNMKMPPGRMPHVHENFFFFAAFRDGIVCLVPILIAYSIRMSQHVTLLCQKQQESEVARRDAELRGLRNQISPHFLLNTLNNIYALATISANRTQSAVMQLSHMLRHMLYDNQDEFVTLTSEASFIESYIELMRLRLSSNVTVETHIDINPESKTLVAPLLFISLVENAFKHGVSASEPCNVGITLEENDNSVHCFIQNSNHPKTPADRSGHGIGLQNVQRRLNIMYQGKYTWKKGLEGENYISEITIKK